VHLPEQLDTLNKLKDYLSTMQFNPGDTVAQLPCQKGARMAINCAIQLQEDLANQFDSPYLMTGNICQCFLESFFGVMRAKGGCNIHPTGMEFLERVGRFCKEKFLKDPNFDIEALKAALPERPPQISDDCDDEDTIPPSLDEQLPYEDSQSNMASQEGIFWIAGNYISFLDNICYICYLCSF
jgi:hypothetical protein